MLSVHVPLATVIVFIHYSEVCKQEPGRRVAPTRVSKGCSLIDAVSVLDVKNVTRVIFCLP